MLIPSLTRTYCGIGSHCLWIDDLSSETVFFLVSLLHHSRALEESLIHLPPNKDLISKLSKAWRSLIWRDSPSLSCMVLLKCHVCVCKYLCATFHGNQKRVLHSLEQPDICAGTQTQFLCKSSMNSELLTHLSRLCGSFWGERITNRGLLARRSKAAGSPQHRAATGHPRGVSVRIQYWQCSRN